MPFTPFHMGPGLAIKAFGGRYFSVLVFAIAQVAMDIEPLIGMIRGSDVLHGWSHSYVGATAIGVLVMLLAPRSVDLFCGAGMESWSTTGLAG
jgi:hypothetical protein